jgi:hypothetical protein
MSSYGTKIREEVACGAFKNTTKKTAELKNVCITEVAHEKREKRFTINAKTAIRN